MQELKFFLVNLNLIYLLILMKIILQYKKLFKKIKGKPYSINTIDKILDEIDQLQLRTISIY